MRVHYVVLFFFLIKESKASKKSATHYYNFIQRGGVESNVLKANHAKLRTRKCEVRLRCTVEGLEYTVRDLNDSINFYKNVLNFRVLKKEEKAAYLVLQDNPTYIKLLQNERPSMRIGEHSFLGLGLQLKELDTSKTKLFKGQVEEEIEKRPITACILPDEDAQTRRFWKNCFLLDPDGYGIEVVLEKEENKFDRIRFFTTSTKDCQKFYTDLLGMELVKIQSHLEETSYPWNIFGGMSYYFSSPINETQLQFAYAYDEDKLLMGNTFPKIILSFSDLSKVKKKLTGNNIELTEKEDKTHVKDLNGYNIILQQKHVSSKVKRNVKSDKSEG